MNGQEEFFKSEEIKGFKPESVIYKEDDTHRKCKMCSNVKEINNFGVCSTIHAGRKYVCTKCCNILSKVRKKLQKIYPAPPPGNCPICSNFVDNTKKNKWILDHCHHTDKFRGYICNNCNLGLGRFKDDLDILKLAVKYLEREI